VIVRDLKTGRVIETRTADSFRRQPPKPSHER
jgi:hypothetical protein